MPRPEDIAWKFVVRLDGKRWCCPYCHKVSSGSVTRVKGHFLKQPKEGIASCTKVPEHICTLMELLLNHEVHNKEDIAWKFVDRVEDNKWRCHYCSVEFSGDLRGVKGHLLKVPNEGISICTEVPDHAGTLMRSLLDEVAEEGSRGANSQSSLEPQSRGMPAQAEVAEDESGEANGESSMVPQSCEMSTQVEVAEEESRDANSQSFIEPLQTPLSSPDLFSQDPLEQMVPQFMTVTDIGVNSDQQSQVERQLHPISTEPLSVQSSHGESSSCSMMALGEAEVQSYILYLLGQPQCSIRSQMPMNDQQTPAGESASQYDQLPAVGNLNCLQDGNQHSQLQILMHSDPSIASQHTIDSHVTEELLAPLMENYTSDQQVQPALLSPQHQCVLHQSINHETRDMQQNATMPLDNQDTTRQPDLHDSLLENLVESLRVIVNAPEEIQTNEHNPTVGSSLQNDLSFDVDSTNCLQDCSQPCVVEEVPLLGNTNPTDAVQHYDHLHSRCDKEDGNDTHVPSPTPMDIDPSTVDPRVLEAATNTRGPLSSQDMNRGSPIMNVGSIRANDEEIRNLKRKVEELDNKEAVIKEQMEIESAASSVWKKPRILVERWLKETERARNNFQIIGQANAELPPKEQVETVTREVEELIGKTLPQTLLIEERDAKVDTFLERELTGEAIHRNIELIWGHLKKNHACKLGICGMGGVGKTTIMMHIHNRLLKDATFDGVAFITVSQDFSIYKLQSDIWKALNFGFMKDEHEKKRAAKLSERLKRKKNCVLILDDVWERLDLEEVGIPVRADGFKLVLTTRSFNVCRQMLCQQKIKIEPLSEKEAEGLFLKELGSEVTLNLEIEAIVKSIVKECAGLPIGVITMARSMREVTEVSEWSDSLVKLRDSSIGQTDMQNRVLMKLKFSYDRLGKPDVQQCFLSCALYPEDKLINKFKLVELFIDQGLIGGLSTRKEQYDRGLSILNELENVCLLENHWGQVKMHDLIRDMALLIMSATSIVKAGKWLRRIPPEEYWTDVLEKVSLMENNIREFPLNFSPSCPKLSTLLLDYGLSRDSVIPDCFFEKLWGLKVLNLSGYNMSELPNSMSDLVNLRALLLRDCRELRRIPYLGKLTSLRKLDASGCESLEVLEGLEMLVNLRYLDLTETSIERLPKGTLDHLLNLQCLEVSAVNEEDITKLGALETVGCYPQNADDFNKCVRVIEQSDNPRYYNLIVNLGISEFVAEVSDDARFGNLERSVKIEEWGHAIVSVGGEYTGIFILIPRDVQTMTMTKCNGITNLPGMGRLEYLEGPEIGERMNLVVLRGGPDEVIDIHDSPATAPTPLFFSSLRVLKIEECPKLKYLFVHDSKSNLPHLQKIEISDCEEMVGIIAAVTSPPPHLLPFFPSLEEISVDCCDKMKRVVESEWMPHFPNLRIIKVLGCGKMEEIIGDPPPCLPVEEISLKFLDVDECDNMRKLFSHEWLLHLRNLQSIEVTWCVGMVEMISGAGQGQEGSTMTPVNNIPSSFQPSISLPKLERLELYILPQLKSICKVPISCDSMKELVVDDCPELKEIPLRLQLCGIEELPHVYVEHEEKWKTLMWDHPNAQAILQPYLRNGKHAKYPFWWEGTSPPNAIELDARERLSHDSALEESPAARPCFPAKLTQVSI